MELTFPFWCPENPNWLNCKNVPILNIPGFNIYEEHVIEQDERFGAYSLCNPDPDTGVFSCVPSKGKCWYENPQYKSFSHLCKDTECHCPAVFNASVGREYCPLCDIPIALIPDCPKQCQAYLTAVGVKNGGSIPAKVLRNVELGDCCAAAKDLPSSEKSWTYDNETRVCEVFDKFFHGVPGNNSFSGFLWAGGLNGTAQFWLGSTRDTSRTLNGTWISTVENGECKEGQQVGVDCWWRKLETKKTVNATCVSQNLVKGVVEKRPDCWRQNCPSGWKTTDECSVRCLFEAIKGTNSSAGPMERDDICRGFRMSFESSDPSQLGCPEDPVYLPSL